MHAGTTRDGRAGVLVAGLCFAADLGFWHWSLRLTSVANAVVRQITTDKNTGQPDGAIFIDRLSHREMQVKARVIVLAAGTLESTRLLLNNATHQVLANGLGLLGVSAPEKM